MAKFPYRGYLWKALCIEVWARAAGRCQTPGCTREGKEVHHLEPVETNPSRAFDLSNLRLLCPECHCTVGHGFSWENRPAWWKRPDPDENPQAPLKLAS